MILFLWSKDNKLPDLYSFNCDLISSHFMPNSTVLFYLRTWWYDYTCLLHTAQTWSIYLILICIYHFTVLNLIRVTFLPFTCIAFIDNWSLRQLSVSILDVCYLVSRVIDPNIHTVAMIIAMNDIRKVYGDAIRWLTRSRIPGNIKDGFTKSVVEQIVLDQCTTECWWRAMSDDAPLVRWWCHQDPRSLLIITQVAVNLIPPM